MQFEVYFKNGVGGEDLQLRVVFDVGATAAAAAAVSVATGPIAATPTIQLNIIQRRQETAGHARGIMRSRQ